MIYFTIFVCLGLGFSAGVLFGLHLSTSIQPTLDEAQKELALAKKYRQEANQFRDDSDEHRNAWASIVKELYLQAQKAKNNGNDSTHLPG